MNSIWHCHLRLVCFRVVLLQGLFCCCWISDFLNTPLHESLPFFPDHFYGRGCFIEILAHWLPLLSAQQNPGTSVGFLFLMMGEGCCLFMELLSFCLFCPETVSQTLLLYVVSASKSPLCRSHCDLLGYVYSVLKLRVHFVFLLIVSEQSWVHSSLSCLRISFSQSAFATASG